MIYALQRLVNLVAKKRGPINVRDFLPCGETVSTNIEKLRDETKVVVIDELKQVKAVTLCCDHWTEKMNDRAYLACAVQYYLNSKIVYRVLTTRQAEDKKKATNSSSIKAVLQEFGKNLLFCLPITDNRSQFNRNPGQDILLGDRWRLGPVRSISAFNHSPELQEPRSQPNGDQRHFQDQVQHRHCHSWLHGCPA